MTTGDTNSPLAQVIKVVQEEAAKTWKSKLVSRDQMREHIASIYVTHRSVCDAYKGDLEAMYRANNIPCKKVAVGVNFGPYLRLVWGAETKVSDKHYSVFSRCLNKIHAEVNSNPGKYLAETIIKEIASFIDASGGFTALAGYRTVCKPEIDDSIEESDPVLSAEDAQAIEVDNGLQELTAAWLSEAEYSEVIGLPIESPVSELIGDGLGLMLVRNVGGTLQLLGTTKNPTTIDEVAAKRFRSSFAPLDVEIRAIMEAMRSQCLTGEHYHLQAQLADKVTYPNDEKKPVRRRLMYVGATRSLLLSPVDALSGVVTLATMRREPLLPGDDDLVLGDFDFRRAERELIGTEQHSLWTLASAIRPREERDYTPKVVFRLKHLFKQDHFLPLFFWQSEQSQPPLDGQLTLKTDDCAPLWSTELDGDGIRALTANVVDPWFAYCAPYCKRKEQLVLRIKFGAAQTCIDFIRRNGIWEKQVVMPWASTIDRGRESLASHYFLAKDVMPLLQSLPNYGVTGSVHLKLIPGALLVCFSNAVADYTVGIPTSDNSGVRDQEAFSTIVPNQYVSFETEHGVPLAAEIDHDYEVEE